MKEPHSHIFRTTSVLFLFVYISTICLFAQDTTSLHRDTILTNHNGYPIQKHKIIIKGDINYPPYEYIDDNGKMVGYNIELLAALMKELGYNYELELIDWGEAMDKIENHEIDMLSSASFSVERLTHFNFSAPHAYIRQCLVFPKDSPVKSIEQLINKDIVIQNNTQAYEILEGAAIADNLVVVDDIREGLKILSAGKADVALCEENIVKFILKNYDIDNLDYVVITDIKPIQYCFVVDKNEPELLNIINKGLGSLKEQGIYDYIYFKWFGHYEEVKGVSLMAKIIITIIILLLILSILFIFIVRQRVKQATRKLNILNRELQLALKAGQISAWTYNIGQKTFYTLYGDSFAGEGISLQSFMSRISDNQSDVFADIIQSLSTGATQNAHCIICYLDPYTQKTTYYESEIIRVEGGKSFNDYLIGTSKDITKDYLYQKELEESNKKIELAVKTSNMVIWEYNTISQLFTSKNDPVNNFNPDIHITPNDYLQASHPDFIYLMNNCFDLMNNGRDEDFHFELRLRGALDSEGEYESYTLVTGSPLDKDMNGKVIKYVGFRRDVTDIYRREQQLKEYIAKTNLITQSSEIVQWDYNVEKRLFTTSFSPLVNKAMVMTIPEYLSCIHPEDLSIAQSMIRILNRGEVNYYETEFRFIEKDVCNWNIINICSAEKGKDGKTAIYTGMSRNNNDWKNMISELVVLKERAEKSDRLKSAFLANISHEIRTPLNLIVGFSRLIGATEDDNEKMEYRAIIEENNTLLLTLIDQIIDLSVIQSKNVSLNISEFDMNILFSELESTFNFKNTNKKVRIICDIPDNPTIVKLDRQRISQVVSNFMSNAFKFTSRGSVTMSLRREESGVNIYIADTGIGISPDKINSVFDRFEKASDFSQGTGLGMAINKALVEAMGGNIGVKSKLGEGTTFNAFIPC